MNNPFRNRSQEYGRDRSDAWRGSDDRYRAENPRYDEDRSWRGADQGRERTRQDYGRDGTYPSEAGASGYGYGQYERDDRGYDDGASRSDSGRNRGDWAGGYGRQAQSAYGYGRSDFGGRSQQADRSYGGGQYQDDPSYEAQGYAPGAQIWDQSGGGRGSRQAYGRGGSSHSEFEPDYLHWREQQMSRFDNDYRDWRSEKRQKFTSDFDTWRAGRAENPIIGDVSDGGFGDQKDAKKS